MSAHEVERMAAVWLCLTIDTELSQFVTDEDRKVFQRRIKAEGITLLTVVLPRLAKALERSFSTGFIQPVEGFRSAKGATYPRFLSRAWEQLFDPLRGSENVSTTKDELRTHFGWALARNLMNNGSVLDHTVAGAVRAIRQLSLMYYKTKTPYSEEQLEQVNQAFYKAEADLVAIESTDPIAKHYIDPSKAADFRPILSKRLVNGRRQVLGVDNVTSSDPGSGVLTRARVLVHRLLQGSDPLDIRPRHGSGVSADKRKPWERYAFKRFIPKLDRVYPYSEWFFAGVNHLVDEHQSLEALPVEDEPMARIAYVPKDSRGPRIISTEPSEFMFIQQGLMAKLYEAIESYPIVREHLSCLDQTRNQILAREGSLTGNFATLDLKEASDRVSLWLVRRLFPGNWVESFEACRSTRTRFPNGDIVTMRKFAPMGSAVCFPVEAICFWALSLAAIETNVDKLLKSLYIRSDKAQCPDNYRVCVFGDDIIIPTEHVDNVSSVLNRVGLVVNEAKSFATGPFRESCGADYLFGEDVSVIRCREIPVDGQTRNSSLAARYRTSEWFNNLIGKYGTALTHELCSLYQEWYGAIPITARWARVGNSSRPDQDGLFLIGDHASSSNLPTRWNSHLHRREVYTVVAKPVYETVLTDSWSYVLRSLLVGGSPRLIRDGSPSVGPVRFALAKRNKYKYGWVPL